ncbi:coiled-coil domain-containing protein [Nonomuraea sp. LPB2021202275-12-8]|uniref:coiled-coil domain-containing protein n=1 Tax=Nonomuraea sp. LPB2021202275-12-8 TaxID=3120159 RepID=UPI00300D0D79
MAAASPAQLAIGVITAAAVALIPATGSAAVSGPAAATTTADPKPTESRLRAELKALNQKVDKLIERYNLKRVELAEAQKAAEAAKKRLDTADEALTTAQRRVAELASLRYQNGGMPLPTIVMPPDGAAAAVLEQLTANQTAVVQGVADARDEKKKAADDAAALARDISADTAEVAKQRDDAKDVIGDIQKKLQELVPFSTGRRSDGSWAPQLPSGADNITGRTRAMREQIQKNFRLPFSVGCFRSGGGGEHPLGRACDFMMSTGGSMPSAVNNVLGDSIAAWTLQNRDKLGVKYVIWKQRINHGSGWSAMSDRGSVTENHYDHVHVSMQ